MKTRQSLWSRHHLSQTQARRLSLTSELKGRDHAKRFGVLKTRVSPHKTRRLSGIPTDEPQQPRGMVAKKMFKLAIIHHGELRWRSDTLPPRSGILFDS